MQFHSLFRVDELLLLHLVRFGPPVPCIESRSICPSAHIPGAADDVCAVLADGGGGLAAGVRAVRLVQRADVVGQRVWGCGVGGVYAGPCRLASMAVLLA